MYPAVKRAYDDKVPVELSEQEFWTRYFQSEYFTRDKGKGVASSLQAIANSIQNENKIANNGSQMNNSIQKSAYDHDLYKPSNDIFSKYEGGSDTFSGKRLKLGKDMGHWDVDLTSTLGDYHAPEQVDPADRKYNSTATVARKYNRNSSLVLGTQLDGNGSVEVKVEQGKGSTSSHGHGHGHLASGGNGVKRRLPSEVEEATEGLSELNRDVGLKYAPLKLSDSSKTSEQFEKIELQPVPNGVPSNSISSSIESQITPADILANMASVFPSPQVAMTVLTRFRNDLADVSAVGGARYRRPGEGSGTDKDKYSSRSRSVFDISGGRESTAGYDEERDDDVHGDGGGEEDRLIPEAFRQARASGGGSMVWCGCCVVCTPLLRSPSPPSTVRSLTLSMSVPAPLQVMLERFSSITELLRHFYSILSREGRHAPRVCKDSSEKIERILKRLDEILIGLQDLRKSAQQSQKNAKVLSRMMRCVHQQSQLIHRALEIWD
eukprot:gene2276-2720_t